MKQYFYLIIWSVSLLPMACLAQPGKGFRFLGATVGFSGSAKKATGIDPYEYKLFNNVFAPTMQAGKFIGGNTLLGIGIGSAFNFSTSRHLNDNTSPKKSGSNVTELTASPFVRHYKYLSPKWAIYLQSSGYFSFFRYNSFLDEQKESETGFESGLRIVPGVSYWLSERFALETDINLFSFWGGYRNFRDAKAFFINSSVTSTPSSYFSLRAAWYFNSTK